MTPGELLNRLHEEGMDASADFNDNEEILGYFGWRIEDDVLTVYCNRGSEDDGTFEQWTHSWLLVDEEYWVIPT